MEMNFSKIDWAGEPSQREKLYFVVILLLFVFVFARLLWMPTMAKTKIRKQEISNTKVQISTLKKFININEKLKQEVKPTDTRIVNKHIEEALGEMPNDPQQAIALIIQDVTSRRLLGSVIIDSVSFDNPVAKLGYAAVPITMSLEGTFSSLQNYMSRLEKLKYLFTVDNITFKASDKHPGMINAVLNSSLYVGSRGLKLPQVKNGAAPKSGKKAAKK